MGKYVYRVVPGKIEATNAEYLSVAEVDVLPQGHVPTSLLKIGVEVEVLSSHYRSFDLEVAQTWRVVSIRKVEQRGATVMRQSLNNEHRSAILVVVPVNYSMVVVDGNHRLAAFEHYGSGAVSAGLARHVVNGQLPVRVDVLSDTSEEALKAHSLRLNYVSRVEYDSSSKEELLFGSLLLYAAKWKKEPASKLETEFLWHLCPGKKGHLHLRRGLRSVAIHNCLRRSSSTSAMASTW